MEDISAETDPYLPYDGGGDTIPLQELPKRGMPRSPHLSFLLNGGWRFVSVCLSIWLQLVMELDNLMFKLPAVVIKTKMVWRL